jgi:hypothetical protein
VSFALQDGDRALFTGVLTDAVTQLFETRTYDLAAPIEIPDGGQLTVRFDNPTTSASSNSVLVQGLPGPLLSQREESIRGAGGLGGVPETNFAFKTLSVPAGEQVRSLIELPKNAAGWVTDHFEFASTSGKVAVRLEESETTLMQKIPVESLVELSEHRLSMQASFQVGDRDSISIEAANPTDKEQTVSVLAPLYEQAGALTRISSYDSNA